MSDDLLAAALEFAGDGKPVFPLHTAKEGRCTCGKADCDKPGKHPRTEHGFKDATTNESKIREWWAKWPSANIGHPTGRLVVLDVDGPEGEAALEELQEKYSPLPVTLTARTGRGRHLYFAANSAKVRNSAGKLGPLLDVRGDGGYVILPPSIHENGSKYDWITRMKSAPLPAWLAALLAEPTRPQRDSTNTDQRICKGQRNSRLASLAGSMRRREMSQAAIEIALLEENKQRCAPPLPESEVRKIAASVARYEPAADAPKWQAQKESAHEELEHLAKLVSFAEIQPKQLRWLWRERFPAGKLSLIVGDPDKGKSLITLDMAARISTGKPFPDGAPCERGSVIILSAEDDAEDTIRPRLEAAGADLARVHWLEAVRVVQRAGKQGERTFSLEVDIAALYDAIKQHPDVRLIVIDPLSAYLGGTESQKNAEVRVLLAPLKGFTAQTGVTVLGITHFRKSSGPAIHRSIDSIAFVAAARAVWGVAVDPNDPDKRIMLRIKGNLSRDPGGLAYRIKVDCGLPRIAWEQGAVNLRADDVLGGLDSREDGSERQEAAQWLREFLAAGPKTQKEIQRQSDQSGFSWATVRRAKKDLRIGAEKSAFRGFWEWNLPEDAQPQREEVSAFGGTRINKGKEASLDPEDAQPENVSSFAEENPLGRAIEIYSPKLRPLRNPDWKEVDL